MTEKRDIKERTFEFATRVVRLCRALEEFPGVSRTLANQLLRSGTSVGANVEEAHGSHSKPDFIAKMSIATKEARETNYTGSDSAAGCRIASARGSWAGNSLRTSSAMTPNPDSSPDKVSELEDRPEPGTGIPTKCRDSGGTGPGHFVRLQKHPTA